MIRNHRYYDPLRLPNVRPGFVRFAPPPVPCVLQRVRFAAPRAEVSVARQEFYLYGRLPPHRFSRKDTFGSPKFPIYPCDVMPWSQTPVVSRLLASIAAGIAAFRTSSRRRLSSGFLRIYPLTTTIHFTGLNTEPAPCLPRLRTPVAGFARGFGYWPAGWALARWDSPFRLGLVCPEIHAHTSRMRSPTG
jgi:hypothetical protein